jgi:hypothetical protein
MTLEELLAVIHRDGGHHTAEVGIEQSCKDAERIIHEMRGLLGEVMEWHADNDASSYNGCDTRKCFWCELASKHAG